MYSVVATITYVEREISPAVDTCIGSYEDYGSCITAVQRRLVLLEEVGCNDVVIVSLSVMKHVDEVEAT